LAPGAEAVAGGADDGALMDLAQIVRDYGYIAILIGTFLEGETIVLIAGFLAFTGHLDLPLVILAAFVGSCSGDQLYFFIGRFQGRKLLKRFPAWQERTERVFYHVHRHQNLLILSFRFFYGLRNVTPFAVGMSEVTTPRFVSLNIIGAAVWATTFGFVGYSFGHAFEQLLGTVKKYEMTALGLLVVLGLTIWLSARLRNHYRKKHFVEEHAGSPAPAAETEAVPAAVTLATPPETGKQPVS
jgi:membrane protein DedA with SNARE-associated domain